MRCEQECDDETGDNVVIFATFFNLCLIHGRVGWGKLQSFDIKVHRPFSFRIVRVVFGLSYGITTSYTHCTVFLSQEPSEQAQVFLHFYNDNKSKVGVECSTCPPCACLPLPEERKK